MQTALHFLPPSERNIAVCLIDSNLTDSFPAMSAKIVCHIMEILACLHFSGLILGAHVFGQA